MTLDTGMHIVGVVSLVAIAAIAAWIIVEAVLVDRHRILAALRGEPIPPAASVAPLATAHPPLHAVEADVEPTRDRLAA